MLVPPLQSRKNLLEMEDLFYDLSNFAAEENEWEGMGLRDVVEKVKPDILIGLSGQGGIFTGRCCAATPQDNSVGDFW